MRGILSLCAALLLTTWGFQTAFSAASGANGVESSFAMKLYSEVASTRKGKNLLMSPFSVSTALSLTHPGAAGETKAVLGKYLGLSDEKSYWRLKERADSLQNPGGGTKLEIANSLFGNKNVTFKDAYLAICKKYFDAPIQSLDFSTPAALKTINDWVKQKTHEKIPTILDQVDNGMVLVLINALYFKGTWEHEFEKKLTKEEDFALASGGTKKVQMMHQRRDDFWYFDSDEFQAIKLPYADKRLSLCVFLPRDGKTLSAFEGSLTSSKLSEYMQNFSKREGNVGLPRFKVEDRMELQDQLKAIGLAIAFDPDHADFSEMAKTVDRFFISEVVHKTFMEVNEEGTEAAAATAVVMRATMAPMNPEQPFEMIVNRPFFIVLHDDETGEDLFYGRIVKP